jgi:pyruvate, orthophosphate dikinase
MVNAANYILSNQGYDMGRISKYIYRFGSDVVEGNGSMRAELGGKGAGLAEMALLSIPIPPGLTISTAVCRSYPEHGIMPPGLKQELESALHWLEGVHGRRLDDKENPLLESVRSGAAVSMPGMMDTILNVGLNERNLNGLAKQNGSLRFALDSYRRLLQMFGSVVLDVPKKQFDFVIEAMKEQERVTADSDISESGLRSVVDEFHEVILRHTGAPFPEDPRVQLTMAVKAVFQSWQNDRAQYYRRLHNIEHASGTAVTIQAMAFGNRGWTAGLGDWGRFHPESFHRHQRIVRRVPGQCSGRRHSGRDTDAEAHCGTCPEYTGTV